jgi:hypothetical protein
MLSAVNMKKKSVEGTAYTYSSWLCEGAFPPGNRKTGIYKQTLK